MYVVALVSLLMTEDCVFGYFRCMSSRCQFSSSCGMAVCSSMIWLSYRSSFDSSALTPSTRTLNIKPHVLVEQRVDGLARLRQPAAAAAAAIHELYAALA